MVAMKLSRIIYTGPYVLQGCKEWSPRYCPSIEDKIVHLLTKTSSTILEPEGRNTEEVYVQDCQQFTEDVQQDLVHSIKGLEKAEMMRTGYAIEYDMVLPHQLRATLETKKISVSLLGKPMERLAMRRPLVKELLQGSMRSKILRKPELIWNAVMVILSHDRWR